MTEEWNEERAAHWDTAVKGSDALRGAIRRNALCEAAVWTDKVAVQSLWDISKLYDNVDWAKLAPLALKLNYSAIMLALGLQARCAQRIIVANNAATEPIFNIGCSILAGCTQSTTFAIIVLYDILEVTHSRWPEAGPKQHIDDLSQSVWGSHEFVASQLTESGVLANELKQMGFGISSSGNTKEQQSRTENCSVFRKRWDSGSVRA